MKALILAVVLFQSSTSFASLYKCDSVAMSAAMKAQRAKFDCNDTGCTVDVVRFSGLVTSRGQTTTIKKYNVEIDTESGRDNWLVLIDSLNGCNVKSVKYLGEI